MNELNTFALLLHALKSFTTMNDNEKEKIVAIKDFLVMNEREKNER
jgi:hypothetical protein